MTRETTFSLQRPYRNLRSLWMLSRPPMHREADMNVSCRLYCKLIVYTWRNQRDQCVHQSTLHPLAAGGCQRASASARSKRRNKRHQACPRVLTFSSSSPIHQLRWVTRTPRATLWRHANDLLRSDCNAPRNTTCLHLVWGLCWKAVAAFNLGAFKYFTLLPGKWREVYVLN